MATPFEGHGRLGIFSRAYLQKLSNLGCFSNTRSSLMRTEEHFGDDDSPIAFILGSSLFDE